MKKIRFISAGAGSGKTFALAEILYGELSAGRVKPAGVMATTFTNRAADELRARVFSHLIGKNEFVLASQMGQASIGTVNSVCGGLLKRFAFEAAMPVDQAILDEAGADDLLRVAIDAVTDSADLERLLFLAHRLGLRNDPLGGRAPWRSALRRLIDEARANLMDASSLVSRGVVNAQDFLAHFPQVTIPDLDAKLAADIAQAMPQLRAAHEAGKKTRVTADYLDQLDSATQRLAKGAMCWSDWAKLAKAAPEKALLPIVKSLAATAGLYMQHDGLRADVSEYLSCLFHLAGSALTAYANAKEKMGLIDFIDQESRLLAVLDHPVVARTLDDELDLLLVDEFQDTSPVQLALFTKLAKFAKQVVWVGDVKQAIYGFRGSDADLMLAVVASLPQTGGGKEFLLSSWRSRPPLVQFVNQLFGSAFPGIPESEVVLQSMRDDMDGAAIEDWLLAGGNKESQYQSLAAGIAGLVADGRLVVDPDDGCERPVRWGDIAMLVRSNANLAQMAKLLQKVGIPCSAAQAGLLATPECVLAIACLRWLVDGTDTIAVAEILSLADCLEPEVWLADRLLWLAQGGSSAAWGLENLVAGRAKNILAEIAALREKAAVLGPRETIDLIVQRCQLPRLVLQWQQQPGPARQRLANLDQLMSMVSRYEEEADLVHRAATVSGLLLYLQHKQEKLQDFCARPPLDAVQLLTHHGAKGLEWPVVILGDLNADIKGRLWTVQASTTGVFDVQNPLTDRFLRYWPWPFGAQKNVALAAVMESTEIGKSLRQAAINEERRLLYVSMTRARDLLIFARPSKKLDGEWMQTVALAEMLPPDGSTVIELQNGSSVPFARRFWTSADLPETPKPSAQSLRWFGNDVSLSSGPSRCMAQLAEL